MKVPHQRMQGGHMGPMPPPYPHPFLFQSSCIVVILLYGCWSSILPPLWCSLSPQPPKQISIVCSIYDFSASPGTGNAVVLVLPDCFGSGLMTGKILATGSGLEDKIFGRKSFENIRPASGQLVASLRRMIKLPCLPSPCY